MIEEAEYVLRDLGFYDVRVRHHELVSNFRFQVSSPTPPATETTGARVETENLKLNTPQCLARIEVGVTEIARLLDVELLAGVTRALKEIGYAHVTLDLQGYRRGSINENTPFAKREAQV